MINHNDFYLLLYLFYVGSLLCLSNNLISKNASKLFKLKTPWDTGKHCYINYRDVSISDILLFYIFTRNRFPIRSNMDWQFDTKSGCFSHGFRQSGGIVLCILGQDNN